MARQLGVKGAVQPTASRLKSNAVRQKKIQLNVDCFWSVSDSSVYEDYDSLIGLR
jgi:hypothetical protein